MPRIRSALIAAQADGQFVVDALTPIADFNERFGADFDDDEYDTIGGLVTAAIGHLPEAGEELTLGRFVFRVARADARRVHAFHVGVLRRCITRAPLPAARGRAGRALRLLAVLLAAGIVCALRTRAAAAPRIGVITMQPGEIFWERFGHNAIVVVDPRDRRGDLLQLRLLRSDRSRTSSAASSAATCATSWRRCRSSRTWSYYREEGRGVDVQWLDLDEAQAQRTGRRARRQRPARERALPLRLLQRQLLHTRARCASTARSAAACASRSKDARRATPTAAKRCVWRRPATWMWLGFDIGLGPAADRPHDAVGAGLRTDAPGRQPARDQERPRPSAGARRQAELLPHRIAPEPAEAPAALVAVGDWPAWRWRRASRWLGARRPRALAAIALPFWRCAGVLGALLLFIWFGTEHRMGWANHNLLLLNPLAGCCCRARWRVLRGRVAGRVVRAHCCLRRRSAPRSACSCTGCRCSRSATRTGSRCCCRSSRSAGWASAAALNACRAAASVAGTMPRMKDPTLPQCVVNCAAYDRDGKRRDISLDAISDVLAVDDGSFVWVGLYEPDEEHPRQAAGGVRPARPRHRGRAQRAPAPEDRGLRQFAVHRDPHRADGRQPHPLRRNPHLRRSALPGDGAPRRLDQLRAGARAHGARAGTAAHGPGAALYAVLDMVVDNYAADRRRVQPCLERTRAGHVRRGLPQGHGAASCTNSSAN